MLLVERGLFPTRAKAQAALLAGKVAVPGQPRPKAGLALRSDVALEVLPDACPYVSRGGLKLAAALDYFKIEPAGRAALDVGSSTGGFTDCLLQRGAAKVYAVDVGRAQLDARLRADPRVVAMEETHARDLRPQTLLALPSPPRGESARARGSAAGSLPDMATIDVSFISLTKVLPHVPPCLAPRAELIALVKPQFELEPKKVPKGIVREQAFRDEAVGRVRQAAERLGLSELGFLECPVRGARGNVEYFLRLAKTPPG